MPNYIEKAKEYDADGFKKFVEAETQKTGHENDRFELVDGQIYMMSSPKGNHVKLSKFIYDIFNSYFSNKDCDIYFAPFDVFLAEKTLFTPNSKSINKKKCKDVTQPDLFVICEDAKFQDDGVHGAPTLVIEIVSKSSTTMDYDDKLHAYTHFGVAEYWIVDPIKRKIVIFVAAQSQVGQSKMYNMHNYTFGDSVESKIFKSLYVDFKQYKWVKE